MYPTVEVNQPTFQPGLILLPGDAVHAGGSFPLQRVKARPEQADRQVVEQGGELPLLPFPCRFPHTRQSLGYASPALCRVRAGLMGVLLDQRPSLLILRRRFPALVRMIHRYYSAVRLLGDVRAGRVAIAFSRRPAGFVPHRHPRGLPVLVHEVSRRVWGLRLRRTDQGLALAPPVMLPSAKFRASAS